MPAQYPAAKISSGHARGADALGEAYAQEHGLKLSVFPADWRRYKRAAGPVRNRQMLTYAQEGTPLVIAFWDGTSRGTGNMIRQAEKAGVEVTVVRYEKGHAAQTGRKSREP